MPGAARREIVAHGEVGAYHCVARCVRRAYLCGKDRETGKDFSHRKEWVRAGLERLAGAFAIDICSYAIMDNHLHVIVRQRPDVANLWSAEDVTRRWRAIFGRAPKTRQERQQLETLVEIESKNPKLVKQRRERMSTVSWLMRCLCEPIARRANREDACKGRFWEGRFRSQALLDDAALLACSAYVDLNPVRAKVAKTPESARYVSIADRIFELRSPCRNPEESRDGWLATMDGHKAKRKPAGRRVSHDPMIPLGLEEYLRLLDWTGRQIRENKRGSIPSQLAPIMDRLKIHSEGWVECVANFGRWFKHAAGSTASLGRFARATHRDWFQGVAHSKASFK